MEINQYEVYWIELDPTKGSEINKTRPCLVISPNEMNHNINTIIIAPVTTTSKNYPSRIKIEIEGKECWVVLDQIRFVDKIRLVRRIGILEENSIAGVKKVIKEMLVD